MTIVYNRSEQCSISHVEEMIIAHEARLDRLRALQLQASAPAALLAHATAPPPSPVVSPSPATPTAPSSATVAPPLQVSAEVNYASSNVDSSSASDDRSRSGDSRGYGDRGGYNNSGGRGGRSNRGGRSSVQCQICHKFGHDASICYHRGNSSSSGSHSQPTMTSQADVSSLLGLFPQFGYTPFHGFHPFGSPAQFGVPFAGSSYGTGLPFQQGTMFASPGYGYTAPVPSGFGFGLFPRAPAQHPRAPQAMLASAPQAMVASAPSTLGSWFPDSGATHHVTHDASVLSDSMSVTGNDQVFMGNGQVLVNLPGIMVFSLSFILTIALLNLRTILGLSFVALLVKMAYTPLMACTPQPFLKGLSSASVPSTFSVTKSSPADVNSTVSTLNNVPNVPSHTSYELWHSRLGHPHHEALQSALSICKIPIPRKSKFSVCQACCVAKSHRLPSSSSTTVYTSPLELIFADLWGPASIESSAGYFYFLTCVDAFSRFTWIYPIKRKSDTCYVFLQFQAMAELKFGLKIKSVQTDGGT
ncbi:uncharacterized protein LOC130744625 [Lotus japonicus]|uniref:uncharacterized protein LOC130744625 n=1 Tax=Lotus japonicus TaxID=34305 RepID=UPI00258E2F16|nr:uncharacterized protein LOC130744625 [Lotus japonicus]